MARLPLKAKNDQQGGKELNAAHCQYAHVGQHHRLDYGQNSQGMLQKILQCPGFLPELNSSAKVNA